MDQADLDREPGEVEGLVDGVAFDVCDFVDRAAVGSGLRLQDPERLSVKRFVSVWKDWARMEQRNIERLGRSVSIVGLGTWQLGADLGVCRRRRCARDA